MNIEERYVNVGTIKTHYYTIPGKGSPVLLLHGGGTDSARLSWGDVMLPLAESGHQVIAPDLPGYGDSDRPDILFNTDFYLRFVNDFMNTIGLKKASFMGLSMGGGISLGMALNHPELVDRLVLVDPYGIQRKVAAHYFSWLLVVIPGIMESSWRMMKKSKANARWSMSGVFYNTKAMPDSLMDEIFLEAGKPFAGRAFTSYQRDEMSSKGLKTVFIERLPELKCPVLYVHGRKDVGVPVACAEEAHRLTAGSQLCVIENAGHWVQREKPEEFIKIVTTYLKD